MSLADKMASIIISEAQMILDAEGENANLWKNEKIKTLCDALRLINKVNRDNRLNRRNCATGGKE